MALAIKGILRIQNVDMTGLLLLVLIVISMAPTHAEDASGGLIFISGYDVNLTPAELEHSDLSGMDRQVSFFDQPFWVQVAFLSGFIGTIPVSLIIFPAIIRKIKKPLINKNRESIFNFIAKKPGCITSQIIEKENIPKGTVRYHIKKLEAEGKIIFKKMTKFVRLFVCSNGISDKEKLVASYTSNEKDRMFLSSIFNSRGMTNKELSCKFNMNKSATYWYLKKFVDANVIEFRQEGRYKKYYICMDVRHIMVKYINSL